MQSRLGFIKIGCLAFGLLAANYSRADETAKAWSAISSPSAHSPESIGGYTHGCLRGAQALPLSGPGYQVMRLSRRRYYGHPDLIDFIQNFGRSMAGAQQVDLLIGDLSQARGGPTLSGHRSHQTGLDADIWFMPLKSGARLSQEEREKLSAAPMVNLRNDQLIPGNWSARQAKMLEAAARDAKVDRIFVNAAIKRELCRHKTSGSSAWLAKIRPWWLHEDHFHVRLVCPADSPHCEKQDSLPAGDGCDASLDWWFSKEAKQPSKPAKPAPPQPLPAACEQVMLE